MRRTHRGLETGRVVLEALTRINGELGTTTVIARAMEILSGLVPGDVVILHPDDRLHDGTRVKQREGS